MTPKSAPELTACLPRYAESDIDGLWLTDTHGRLLDVNETYAAMSGYLREELLNTRAEELEATGAPHRLRDHIRSVVTQGEDRFETHHRRKDGTIFDVEATVYHQAAADGDHLLALLRDISNRKSDERFLAIESEVLAILSAESSVQETANRVVEAIKRQTGLDVVGLRLTHNRSHPFISATGYSQKFLTKTGAVATCEGPEWPCRDNRPLFELESACRLVLGGEPDLSDPLFTQGGSVWTSDSDALVAGEGDNATSDETPRGHVRNLCVEMGLKSMALIPLRADSGIVGLMHLGDRQTSRFTPGSIRHFEELCVSIGMAMRRTEAIASLKAAEHELAERGARLEVLLAKRDSNMRDIQEAFASTIEVIVRIVEVKDPYTARHMRQVSQLATAIAQAVGLSAEEVEEITVAARIHDIGKMAVPIELLTKPGTLLPVEFRLIKLHPEVGNHILVSSGARGSAADIILQHHERLDGSGYPSRLTAKRILKSAKILAVADVVEAMYSHRPYRAALGLEAALAEIETGAGRLYDAEASASCLRLCREDGFRFNEQ